MKWDVLAGAFNRVLDEGDVAEPLDDVLSRVAEHVAESPEEQDAMSEGITALADLPGIESRQLVSFLWDRGGAPISSYLSLQAIHIGDEWFVYFLSDDEPSMLLDRLDVLDRETATSAIERICQAGEYVNTECRPSMEFDDLVDRSRVERLFVKGK